MFLSDALRSVDSKLLSLHSEFEERVHRPKGRCLAEITRRWRAVRRRSSPRDAKSDHPLVEMTLLLVPLTSSFPVLCTACGNDGKTNKVSFEMVEEHAVS